jgi:hypothetical protein
VEPQTQATAEDLDDRKRAAACIEHVIKSNKFRTYEGREAQEEKEKEQFLKPTPIDEPAKEEGGGAEAGGDEEEEAPAAAEKGRRQALLSTRTMAARAKHAAHRQALWAPGQKKVWEQYLAKTDKMNGVASDEDNVIAQWA